MCFRFLLILTFLYLGLSSFAQDEGAKAQYDVSVTQAYDLHGLILMKRGLLVERHSANRPYTWRLGLNWLGIERGNPWGFTIWTPSPEYQTDSSFGGKTMASKSKEYDGQLGLNRSWRFKKFMFSVGPGLILGSVRVNKMEHEWIHRLDGRSGEYASHQISTTISRASPENVKVLGTDLNYLKLGISLGMGVRYLLNDFLFASANYRFDRYSYTLVNERHMYDGRVDEPYPSKIAAVNFGYLELGIGYRFQ